MAYAIQADLTPERLSEKDLVELTDDGGTGEIDATVVVAALDRASGVIDSYAGSSRYTLPLVVSQQVKDLALDLAEYFLFQRRRRIPEDVQTKHDQAMKFLRDVASGKASLDQPSKKQASEMDVRTVDHTVDADQDVFDKEKLKDF